MIPAMVRDRGEPLPPELILFSLFNSAEFWFMVFFLHVPSSDKQRTSILSLTVLNTTVY